MAIHRHTIGAILAIYRHIQSHFLAPTPVDFPCQAPLYEDAKAAGH